MKSESENKTRKKRVKGVHTGLADQNVVQFLNAMSRFDAEAGKGRKLHLARNLIKMVAVSDAARAAHLREHRSSSDISNALLILEQFFGCQLRDESGQSIRFNERGEELIQLTRSILVGFAEFYQHCHALPPRFVVAAGDSILHLLLLPQLARIQAQLPDVIFEVRDMGTTEICEALRQCRVDFGLLPRDAIAKVRNIESRSLMTYGYGVFCPWGLLSGQSKKDDYLQSPFALSKHWGLDVLKMAKKAKVELNVKVWCENFSQVGRLVRVGYCAGVMPQFAKASFRADKYLFEPPEFLRGLEHNLALGWNRRLEKIRPKLRKVAEVLEKELCGKNASA